MKTRVSVHEWLRRFPTGNEPNPKVITNLAKVDTFIFSLRNSLNVLFQENIIRAQKIIKLLERFGQDPNNSEKEAKFIMREFTALLQANISSLESVERYYIFFYHDNSFLIPYHK